MSWFDLKLALSDTAFSGILISPEKGSKTDGKLSELVEGFEYDQEQADNLRKETRGNALKLQRAIQGIEQSEAISMEKGTLQQIRKSEGLLRRQLKDIVKIIKLLKRLIETEDLELIYDVRLPLVAFEDFIKKLLASLTGARIKIPAGEKLKKLIQELGGQYEQLLDYVLKFIKEDFVYFKSIGLEFHRLDTRKETDYALATHIKTRSKIKQRINGKMRWILTKLNQLEEAFKQFRKQDVLDDGLSRALLEHIIYFRKQFGDLVSFCMERVDVAGHMIVESIVLQKEKYEEMLRIKKELDGFYREFIAEQRRIRNIGGSKWRTQQAIKRIEQFRQFQKEVEREIRHFEREFEEYLERARQQELEQVRAEEKEMKKVVARVARRRSRLRSAVAGVLSTMVLAGGALYVFGATKSPSFSRPMMAATQTLKQSGYRELGLSESFKQKNIEKYAGKLIAVRRDFARSLGENDFRYNIVDRAFKYVGISREYHEKEPSTWPLTVQRVQDCISFVNTVLSETVPGHKQRSQMDQIIRDYAARGWQVYFVSKDLTDRAVKSLRGESASQWCNKARNGTYPYVGRVPSSNIIIGPEAVKKFQQFLRKKVALVSFNAGHHSAFILGGYVVQSHGIVGLADLEGEFTLETHLSEKEVGQWEFAIVAVAPGQALNLKTLDSDFKPPMGNQL